MIPFLHFRGDCCAAFTLYREVFGGHLELTRYGGAAVEAPGAGPHDRDRIFHAELRGDGWVLMGSDLTLGAPADPQMAVTVHHAVPDPHRARTIFDALGAGGAPILHWSENEFVPRGSGLVRDRFGTHWLIVARDRD